MKPTVSQHTDNDIIKNRAKRKLTVLMSKLQAVPNTDALVSAIDIYSSVSTKCSGQKHKEHTYDSH